MNVFLHRLLVLFVLAVAVPILSNAQTTVPVRLETYQNQPYQYNFTSSPNNPFIIQHPANGTFAIIPYPGSSFVGTYTPNEDFIGLDNFRIMVWNGPDPSKMEIKDVTIEVMPAEVKANPDFGYTFAETPVSLDVLANDFSSNPSLKLKSVSVANYGAANFETGSPFIDFTPDPGFTGEAYLNYTICDNAGICDNGTITISVLPGADMLDDTIQVFTKKNQPQVVLVPELYQLDLEPAHGRFDNQGDFPTYTPDEQFVGMDYLRFAYNNSYKVVEVRVLDLVDNVVAFDDKAYTSPSEPIEFNVLDNDAYGLESGCFQIVEGPRYGTITEDPQVSGLLTYTPFASFRGVDKFTYTTNDPSCAGPLEEATAYVYIGNFEPASSKYRMVTPKYTPLVIGNNVPISNFEFRIADQGELGRAFFMEGDVDTTIYGQTISGYNMIVYAPSSTAASGVDEFEVVYCVKSGPECVFEKSVKIEVEILDINDGGNDIMCVGDCIWAGDTNLDGIVNISDLLPLGLHMGSVGKPRPAFDPDTWYGQYGEDWLKKVAEIDAAVVNLKHLDTNGDSLITSLDTAAIGQFYGRTHSLNAAPVPYYEHRIRLKGNFSVRPGDLIVLDMYIGDSLRPAEDVYGFTFPYRYDPNFFDPKSVDVQFARGSFLDYNAPVLQMTHNNLQGLTEAGFTRTDNKKVSGFGKIGSIVSAVVDDLDGFKFPTDSVIVKVGGGTAMMMNSQGQSFGVDIEEVTIKIQLSTTEELEEELVPTAEQLILFPNPTRDLVNIHLNGGQDFERFIIFNATGQAVYESEKVWTNHAQVNVSQWPEGMYFLNVYTAKGVVNKKLEVVRW